MLIACTIIAECIQMVQQKIIEKAILIKEFLRKLRQ